MKPIAIIPARGGSKSIPKKNIKKLNGIPLIFYCLKAALNSKIFSKIFVTTDCAEIAEEVVKKYSEKIQILPRSPITATDTASTESVLLEILPNLTCEEIFLIQATSPFVEKEDFQKAYKFYQENHFDTLLTCTRQKRFLWEVDQKFISKSINYDHRIRPRRQDFEGYLVENGCFYIFKKEPFLKNKVRLFDKIGIYEMEEANYLEIDEPIDWEIATTILQFKSKRAVNTNEIKMLVTDVDGCLTDAGMYYSNTGDELKKFNTRDGMGLSMIKDIGIKTCILTSENTAIVKNRSKKLNIDILKQGCVDKLKDLKQICKKNKIKFSEIAYIGDDLNDLECMLNVGFTACPKNASREIKNISQYISKHKGGNGVVREVCEFLIKNKKQK